jgi:predicted porin
MNKGLFACMMLGGYATLACAQDSTSTAVNGDVPGGHAIAVFSGEPVVTPGTTPNGTWSRQAARRAYGPLDALGPSPGAGGFTLGRQYNLEYLAQADVADPFHAGTAGKPTHLVTADGRPVEETVRYYSSQVENFVGGSSWTVDVLGNDPMADRAWGMSAGYDYGPISLRASHQNRHVAQIHFYDLAGNNMDAKNSIIAANLRTRWGTAYAAYAANRGWGSSPLYNPDNPYGAGVASTASTDSRDTLAGIAVPLTRATTFLASFIHKNDRDLANRDANQIAFGASYVVSRKTDFYAAVSHTVNTNGTGVLISGAARPSGSSAVNVGMRHAF